MTLEYQLRAARRARQYRQLSVIATFLASTAVGASLFGAYFQFSGISFYRQPPDSLQSKIDSLSKALGDSASTIDQIQGEITHRQELLQQLRKDAEVAKQLAEVNAPQADAIVQTIRLEMEREKRSDFWLNVFQNFIFAVFGVVLAEIWHFIRRRLST